MPAVQETIDQVRSIDVDQYKYGFETEVEMEKAPKGLSEDVIRFISAKKGEPEWMLEWRLDAYRRWLTMQGAELGARVVRQDRLQRHLLLRRAEDEPVAEIPRRGRSGDSQDLREARHPAARAGDPGRRRAVANRVAVDAVFDSVSVATTFKEELKKAGVIFMPISEAIREHPDLVRQYLGTVVPVTDNFFATLNSAVFTDGSFVYVPPGVRCPMELSTYFRINEKNTGQFERTLIIADKGSYVSYLEGCTAPKRDENQLHAAVVELIALDDAEIKYSTVQNWYPGDAEGPGRHLQLRDEARRLPRQELGHHLDAGRDRLGDHLEISVLHPARRRLARRVLLDRGLEREAAGRFRHQDDPSRQEHDEPDHLEGHRGGQVREHLSRPRLGAPQGDGRAQLHELRLAADRQQVRCAHGAVHRVEERLGGLRARGDDIEDLRGSAVLLPAARPLGERRRRRSSSTASSRTCCSSSRWSSPSRRRS